MEKDTQKPDITRPPKGGEEPLDPASCSASEAMAILKEVYDRGVHDCDIDEYYIDHDVEISWEIIEASLTGKKSVISKKQSLDFLDGVFQTLDDPFWENVIESIMGELDQEKDGADLISWDQVVSHF